MISLKHLILVSISLTPLAVLADPAGYIKLPAIEYGEREIEVKYGSSKLGEGEGRESAGTFGFGYGVTPTWFTEAYLKYKKALDDRSRFDAVEWENKFLLTETGKYPVDVGFFVEIEVPRARSEGYELRLGPLFQVETGNMQLNGNFFLKRQYHSESAPAEAPVTEFHYQAQLKYRYQRELEFGIQALGELGRWNHWDKHEMQNHRVGPAIFGKLPLGGREAIRYDAAWLFGATKASPDSTVRLQLEYEF